MRKIKSIKRKLIERVDKRGKNECWPWKGYRDDRGYGILSHTVRMNDDEKVKHYYAAHRAYLEHVENIDVPEDSRVFHTCDNLSCCNPRHLIIKEAKYKLDFVCGRRGRMIRARGSDHGMTYLEERQVRKIKRLLNEQIVTRQEICDRFRIPKETLHSIEKGYVWSHIGRPVKNALRSNPRISTIAKDLRLLVRKHGTKKASIQLRMSVDTLRRVAYPLAPGYEYRKKKLK